MDFYNTAEQPARNTIFIGTKHSIYVVSYCLSLPYLQGHPLFLELSTHFSAKKPIKSIGFVVEKKDKLWRVAEKQHGYFTAKQAKEAGYRDSNFARYIQSGIWKKIQRGIYCFTHFPAYERPELIIWFLWSQTRKDPGCGVWSHETALEIHDLSDVNPLKMHMTVPERFRKRGKPGFISLHCGTFSKMEIQEKDGYLITTPLRTLVDVFREESLEPSLLRQSVREALSKGMVTKIELAKMKKFYPEVEKILEVVDG
ncbi:MAG: hypothetical protein KR126chlam1_00082 [Chlamydiae bacterium]|nr:hypothetical protein [Chlamydiota bacterium]